MKWPFGKVENNEDLLAQADEALGLLGLLLEELEKEKDQKLQRQVELWSIMNLSQELEQEYKRVGEAIAYHVKGMRLLEKRMKELALARYHCKDKECTELSQLLGLLEPTEEQPLSTATVELAKT